MSTVGNTLPTLLDVSKQFGTDGSPLPIAELLHKTNPMLDDIPFEEANSATGHKISARSGLPAVAWRKLNGGVPATKSNFADVNESMGLLSALGKADKKLVELSNNPARFRLNQNIGHIEAMGQEFASTLFYGDTDIDPEKFLGLAPRFDDITGPLNASQIIDAAGNDTDLFSIWLVGWGENSVMGIYPKGTQAGIVHNDMGVELVSDGAGGEFPAYRDWFELNAGVAVYDWRNIVRIANIDSSALLASAASGANLINLMTMALEQLNNPEGLRPVFYMPRRARAILRQQITNKANVWLSMGEVAGKKVVEFDGIPVRRTDALLSTESRIV
jgi:hypothetical protein